jgi:hypothetical protein
MSARRPHSSSPATTGQMWLKSDVVFLELALARGMSPADVAGFLGRDEDEVRAKADELETPGRDS